MMPGKTVATYLPSGLGRACGEAIDSQHGSSVDAKTCLLDNTSPAHICLKERITFLEEDKLEKPRQLI
jgi:hypothetical protein